MDGHHGPLQPVEHQPIDSSKALLSDGSCLQTHAMSFIDIQRFIFSYYNSLRRGAVQLPAGLSRFPGEEANSNHSSACLRRHVRTNFVSRPTLERSGSINSTAKLLATLIILWMIFGAIKCHSCSNFCISQMLHMRLGCGFDFYSI